METPPNVLEEEPVEPFDDDDAAAEDDDDDGAVMSASVSDIPMTSSVTPLRSSMVLSASVPVTSTPWADQSAPSIIMMSTVVSVVASTPLPSSSVSLIKTTSAILNSPLLTSSVSSMKLSAGTRELLNSFMSANAPVDSNITSAPSASVASLMTSSVVVMATGSSSIATTASIATADESSEPVIKMMIMSGEPELRVQDYGARLPDERAFVEGLGKLFCIST